MEHGISILRDIGIESNERWKSDSVIVAKTAGENQKERRTLVIQCNLSNNLKMGDDYVKCTHRQNSTN